MAYPKQMSASGIVKDSAGKLYSITISSTSSGTLTVYDGTSASGVGVKIIDTITPTAGATYTFPAGMQFSNGLYVAVANTLSFTLTYE